MSSKEYIYRDDKYTLERGATELILRFNDEIYKLTYHAYEPCTYIEHNGVRIVMHDGFDLYFVVKSIENNKGIRRWEESYTPAQFCDLMISEWHKNQAK